MTIVLGAVLICGAALIFAVLAMLCRAQTPPALLQKDLTQTLCLLGLMAMIAVGAGVFAAGFNAVYSTLHLVMAGLVTAGTVAAIAVLAPWRRVSASTEGAATDLTVPTGSPKAA